MMAVEYDSRYLTLLLVSSVKHHWVHVLFCWKLPQALYSSTWVFIQSNKVGFQRQWFALAQELSTHTHRTTNAKKTKTYTHTYLLTPWSRVLLGKLGGFQLLKKFPAFYGTRNFITSFTSARQLSPSWDLSEHFVTRYIFTVSC